jgi:hypothetical protein
LHGLRCLQQGAFVPFGQALGGEPPLVRACEPDQEAHAVYKGMVKKYQQLEKRLLTEKP